MSNALDRQNIYLIGLMGAGKTTIGRAMSKRLGYRFVDSDHEIEARTGVSLPTIFEIEGEEGFRKREAQVIAGIATLTRRVVATGGGAVLRPENRDALRASGMVIYLDVPLATLCERTRNDKKRPLLQVSNPLEKLKQLHAERDPLYRGIADLVVSGSRITAQSLMNLLIEKFGEAWKH